MVDNRIRQYLVNASLMEVTYLWRIEAARIEDDTIDHSST